MSSTAARSPKLLHLPISTVLEYARRGLLPGHKLGRRWIFLRDEVEAAVRRSPIAGYADAAHERAESRVPYPRDPPAL